MNLLTHCGFFHRGLVPPLLAPPRECLPGCSWPTKTTRIVVHDDEPPSSSKEGES